MGSSAPIRTQKTLTEFETALNRNDTERLQAIATSEELSDAKLLSTSILHNRITAMEFLLDVCSNRHLHTER